MSSRIMKKKRKLERSFLYANYYLCPHCGFRAYTYKCNVCENKIPSWKDRHILKVIAKNKKDLRSIKIQNLFLTELDNLGGDEIVSLAMPRLIDVTPMIWHDLNYLETEILK